MKVFKTIDLSPFCNHKLVYERLPDEGGEYGLDNICVLKEDFKFKERETIDGYGRGSFSKSKGGVLHWSEH